jgi:hypothetical protein
MTKQRKVDEVDDTKLADMYRIKELYRVQGENVCWIGRDLLSALKGWIDDDWVTQKMRKLEEAINLFEGV